MSRIGTNQLVGTIYLLTTSMKFSNGASIAAAQQPLGGDGGDAGSLNVVPNLYVVMPINKQWAFGLGVNAPFGLVTEYDTSWIGRFQAVKSDIKTINVNPALSWKPADNFAIGVGADYQQIKATLTSQSNYSVALLGAAARLPAVGHSPGIGNLQRDRAVHARSRIERQRHRRRLGVGLERRRAVGHRQEQPDRRALPVEHQVQRVRQRRRSRIRRCRRCRRRLRRSSPVLAAAVNAEGLYNGGVTSDIELPEIVNVSYFGKLNDRWDIMADVQYTGWSTIQELKFTRTTAASGTVLTTTPENWKNVWRYALGTNYHYDDKWLFRGGVACDQSPVSDTYRTPRLPDGDRIWLAAGAQYKMDRQWAFDFGVAYGWANNNSVDPPECGQHGADTP